MMEESNLDFRVKDINNRIGKKSTIVIKRFYIGKGNDALEAALIYINALASKDIIDRDILAPLMLCTEENLLDISDIEKYICMKYIPMSNTEVVMDISEAIEAIRRGKAVIIIDKSFRFIINDTTAGNYRAVEEPGNEFAIRGSREGFVENLETNVSILRRRIKDKNLTIDYFKVGRRSQTDLAVIYIQDIADNTVIKKIEDAIKAVDVDYITATGQLEQYMEENPHSVFPQANGTEKPDKVEANIMEGRVALLLEGTPYVLTLPCVFMELFQTVEDYYERPIASSIIRILRLIAVIIVISLSAAYLTILKYNSTLIPVKLLIPIIQARRGIALSPFVGIMLIEIIIEFLREGGLRLPTKIAQTLSLVGGIIIGEMAVRSRIVSSSTLFMVGLSTIATFLISNYEMSLTARTLRFPMIILANVMGIFGLIIGWYFILAHLCSLENYGVPYFSFRGADMKDSLIRTFLWKMNKRPEAIPNKNPIRQTDFRKRRNSRRNSNGEGSK